MYPGFILIRYGKTYRHRNDFHEGRSSYSQIPRNMKHTSPSVPPKKAPGLESRQRKQRKPCARAFTVVSVKKARQSRISRLRVG